MTRLELGAAARKVILKGDLIPVDRMSAGAADNRASVVPWQRATTYIADTGHRYAIDGEMRRLATDNLAAVSSRIAETNHLAHVDSFLMLAA
jgi:hypothetical protein